MRVIVMFDLPVTTQENLKNYRLFRKFLIKSGFLMVQESVYCKLVPNANIGDSVVQNIKRNKPPAGLVQVLKVTENQYQKMDYIVGERKREVIDSDERTVFI